MKGVLTRSAYVGASQTATDGGSVSATSKAEERCRRGEGLDPLVDPKGLPHLGLGPIRLSLPRFEQQDNGLWLLANGMPMHEETLLDTTGSMQDNVEIAFKVLPDSYELLTAGNNPVLGRYDVQIINASFGDTSDRGTPVLCRSQAEMDVKIAQQLTMLVPSKDGCGNGKEDPQFGLFAAAYFTRARINEYGLKRYHFTVSDEPIFETINLDWLKQIFGDDAIKWAKENGYSMDPKNLPDATQVVKDLQKNAHAFFLQVEYPNQGYRADVMRQWTKLYGAEYVISLPGGTKFLHHVKACIIGLTEGVLDLESAQSFLEEHKVSTKDARAIVRAVANIPLGAQALLENFNKLPKIGDLFREKTDLWPVDPAALEPEAKAPKTKGKGKKKSAGNPGWKL